MQLIFMQEVLADSMPLKFDSPKQSGMLADVFNARLLYILKTLQVLSEIQVIN
jgi:hypothetical protein